MVLAGDSLLCTVCAWYLWEVVSNYSLDVSFGNMQNSRMQGVCLRLRNT
jgi:hypothetical protein